jgi:hypothetical protein
LKYRHNDFIRTLGKGPSIPKFILLQKGRQAAASLVGASRWTLEKSLFACKYTAENHFHPKFV